MLITSRGRGLHPRITSTTYAAWQLDDATGAVAVDVVGNARPLGQEAAFTLPSVALGVCGNARVATGTQIMTRAANAADVTFAQGSWTLSTWVRLDAVPVGAFARGLVFGLSGPNASFLTDDHMQFACSVAATADASGLGTVAVPEMRWEYGGLSTNEVFSCSQSLFHFTLGEWTFITWVKDVAAGTLVLYVNGSPVQSWTGWTNADGGAVVTNQKWLLCSELTAAPALVEQLRGAVSSVHLAAEVYSADRVAADFRAGLLLDVPSAVHSRAWIADGSDVLRNLSDTSVFLEDMYVGATLSDEVDNPCEALELDIAREAGERSLAPLKGDSVLNNPTLAGSYSPALDVYRRVQFDIARVPTWITPTSTDWVTRFLGRIDEYDDGESPMRVRCRDQGVVLMDTWIDEERQYPAAADLGTGSCGSSAGSRETTLARILSDNGGLATLFTPEATGSCMVQKPDRDGFLPRSHILPALRTIAAQIGWDVNWKRLDPATGTYRLTFFDPGRSRLAAHFVLSPDDLLRTRAAPVSVANVRNDVTVTYPDSTKADSEGRWLPSSVNVSDAASIALYGRRTMEMVEDQTSQISSATEATRMASSAVTDCSTPRRAVTATVSAVPELRTNDVVYTQADGLHTTSDTIQSVRSFTHRFTREGCTSDLVLDGAPGLGVLRWLRGEAGRNGRTPLRSETEGLSSRDLGTKFPALLDVMDRTSFLTTGKFAGLKNFDFARASRGNGQMPDGWNLWVGTFGVDIETEVSDALSGGRALRFIGGQSATIASDLVPLQGDGETWYGIDVVYKADGGGVASMTLTLDLFDEDRAPYAPVGYPVVSTFSSPMATDWRTVRRPFFQAPAGARFMRVRLFGDAATDSIYIDSLNAYRVSREAFLVRAGTQTGIANFNPAAPTYDKVLLNSSFYDYGSSIDLGNNQIVIRERGFYDVVGQVATSVTGGSITASSAVLTLNGSIAAYSPRVAGAHDTAGGADHSYLTVMMSRHLEVGDIITMGVGIESTGSRALIGWSPPTGTWLQIKMRSLD